MGEKPGKVQVRVVEFSADCAAIRAKSGEGGYSEAVDSWRKGVYTSYIRADRQLKLCPMKIGLGVAGVDV